MAEISNEYMQQMLGAIRSYCAVILKPGPNISIEGNENIIWEHGRYNFGMRADGLLSIVCPVVNGNNIRGIGIFNATEEKVNELMKNDPAIKAGIFIYEILTVRSFPGDSLP